MPKVLGEPNQPPLFKSEHNTSDPSSQRENSSGLDSDITTGYQGAVLHPMDSTFASNGVEHFIVFFLGSSLQSLDFTCSWRAF
jgi:hypothetical protein